MDFYYKRMEDFIIGVLLLVGEVEKKRLLGVRGVSSEGMRKCVEKMMKENTIRLSTDLKKEHSLMSETLRLKMGRRLGEAISDSEQLKASYGMVTQGLTFGRERPQTRARYLYVCAITMKLFAQGFHVNLLDVSYDPSLDERFVIGLDDKAPYWEEQRKLKDFNEILLQAQERCFLTSTMLTEVRQSRTETFLTGRRSCGVIMANENIYLAYPYMIKGFSKNVEDRYRYVVVNSMQYKWDNERFAYARRYHPKESAICFVKKDVHIEKLIEATLPNEEGKQREMAKLSEIFSGVHMIPLNESIIGEEILYAKKWEEALLPVLFPGAKILGEDSDIADASMGDTYMLEVLTMDLRKIKKAHALTQDKKKVLLVGDRRYSSLFQDIFQGAVEYRSITEEEERTIRKEVIKDGRR